jgi:hypothetical protein
LASTNTSLHASQEDLDHEMKDEHEEESKGSIKTASPEERTREIEAEIEQMKF